MSDSTRDELRTLDVGTFEIEDLNAIGLNAANMPLSDELMQIDDGSGDLAWRATCSSCSCGSSTSSCSTSSTCSTCSSCSSTSC